MHGHTHHSSVSEPARSRANHILGDIILACPAYRMQMSMEGGREGGRGWGESGKEWHLDMFQEKGRAPLAN